MVPLAVHKFVMLYHSTGFQGLHILCFWDHHLWHLLAESIMDCFKAQMEEGVALGKQLGVEYSLT